MRRSPKPFQSPGNPTQQLLVFVVEVVMKSYGLWILAVVLSGPVACGSSSGGGAGGSSGSGIGGTSGSGGSGGTSTTCQAAGTLNVTNSDSTAYMIDGVANPDLTLCRGSTYTFAVASPGHPFYIKTVQGAGTGNAYDSGVTGNGTDSGMVVFVVPADAPSTLFYNCSLHPPMTGTIHVID
jgi:hypothetical protein